MNDDRHRKIVQRILDNVPYAEIGKEFHVTRQRIHQVKKQEERDGIRFPKRTPGRRRGESVDEIVALLQRSDTSYEELSQESGFTKKQFQIARANAILRGVVIPNRRYSQRVFDNELLKDLKDARLSIKEIASRHNWNCGSLHNLVCRLRKAGEEVPYRGTVSPFLGQPMPWFSKRQRSNVERSALNAELSISDIAEKHGVSSNHAVYVIGRMRGRGVDVPNRQGGSKGNFGFREKSPRRLELEKAIQSNASITEIAKRFGITYHSVQYVKWAMRKQGITVLRRRNQISQQKREAIKKACGLSQAALARKYGVSRSTVGKIKNSESP